MGNPFSGIDPMDIEGINEIEAERNEAFTLWAREIEVAVLALDPTLRMVLKQVPDPWYLSAVRASFYRGKVAKGNLPKFTLSHNHFDLAHNTSGKVSPAVVAYWGNVSTVAARIVSEAAEVSE